MWVAEGERIRSKLNGAVYTVKAINTNSVVLESKNGSNQRWGSTEVLEYFFDKIEDKNAESDSFPMDIQSAKVMERINQKNTGR